GLLQASLDAGSGVLIYQICCTIFAPPGSTSSPNARIVGALAAAGWALFVPAQAYSIVLMPTAWFVFVFWFLAWRFIQEGSARGARECLFLALLVGLTATAVATVMAIIPLMLLALFFRRSSDSRNLMTRLGLVMVGLVLGTSPCWIHNYFIAKDPVIL